MNAQFFLSAVRYLAEDSAIRVFASCGCSELDMADFRSATLWTPDLRVRMRRVLDTVVYGVCDMAMLPRVEVPAELVAAVVAMLVSPINWLNCAGQLEGLKPARDLTNPEETVQIERVSGSRMVTLIIAADAAMRGADGYTDLASVIQSKMTKYGVK